MKQIFAIIAFSMLALLSIEARNETKQDSINSAFFKEVYAGNLNETKLYIEKGIVTSEYYKNDEIAYQLIANAALSGNEELLNYLISKGIDVNLANRSGEIGLHIVAWRGNLEASKLLVDRGSNLEAYYIANGGLTPLRCAAESGNLELVEYLITKMPNQQKILQGESAKAIDGAAGKGYYDTFVYLAQKAPKDQDWKETLFQAIVGNNLDIVKYIIENKKARVNEKSQYRDLPIQEAAEQKFVDDPNITVEIMKYLVSKGAKLSDINNGEIFPWALNESTQAVINYFLEQGYKPNFDSYYKTEPSPWSWEPLPAMLDASNVAMAQYIVDDKKMKNSDPYFRGKPLIVFFADGMYNSSGIIQFLIDNKINGDHHNEAFLSSIINKDSISADILLKAGADINYTDKEGRNALYYIWNKNMGTYLADKGIETNNPKNLTDAGNNFILLQYLKDINIDPKLTDTAKSEGLLRAAKTGDQLMVQYFIDAKANLNVTTKVELVEGYRDRNEEIYIDAQSPLMLNAIQGYTHCTYNYNDGKTIQISPEITKMLIKAGADIEQKDSNRNTALHYTCINQYCRIGIWPIPMGSRRARENGAHGDPAFPPMQHHDFILKELIKAGADINSQNKDGDTPLILAAKNNNNNALRLLIEAGANINIKNNEEKSLLDFTEQFDDILLMEEIGLLSKLDSTALGKVYEKFYIRNFSYQVDEERDQKIIEKLEIIYSHGVDVNKQQWADRTLLNHYLKESYYKYYKNVIKFLINKGANPNIQDSDGKTALMINHYNEDTDRLELVKLLVDAGADVNLKDRNENTALFYIINEIEEDSITAQAVKYLINAGANTNIKNKEGETPLTIASIKKKPLTIIELEKGNAQRDIVSEWWYAIQKEAGQREEGSDEDEEKINDKESTGMPYTRKLLAEGMDVNIRGDISYDKGITALMYVVQYNILGNIKTLLDAGADVNAKDDEGQSVFDYLDYYSPRTLKTIKLLQKYGAKPSKDVYSKYIQELNSYDSNLELRKELITLGADLNYRRPDEERSAINKALYAKNEELIRFIIDQGADLNAKNKAGQTALHYEVRNGEVEYGSKKMELYKMLVDAGADLNTIDTLGYAPLHTAATEWRTEGMTQFLIENGADLNKSTYSGNTPLILAVGWDKSEIVKMLIEGGADINKANNRGLTPLMNSLSPYLLDIMKILIESGADVNLKDQDGFEAIHIAVIKNNKKAIEILIDAGADINAKTNVGHNVLHIAAGEDNVDLIKYLIELGLNVDSKDNDNNTPLHVASFEGKIEATRLLIEKGADVNFRDNTGENALDIARKSENKNKDSIIEILVEAGAK